jgi:hypothetical protein
VLDPEVIRMARIRRLLALVALAALFALQWVTPVLAIGNPDI